MTVKSNSQEQYPVLEGKRFYATYTMPEKSVGWEGDFSSVAARALVYVTSYENKGKSFLEGLSQLLEGKPTFTLLEKNPTNGEYVDVMSWPTITDIDNARTAYYQNNPDAA